MSTTTFKPHRNLSQSRLMLICDSFCLWYICLHDPTTKLLQTRCKYMLSLTCNRCWSFQLQCRYHPNSMKTLMTLDLDKSQPPQTCNNSGLTPASLQWRLTECPPNEHIHHSLKTALQILRLPTFGRSTGFQTEFSIGYSIIQTFNNILY